MHLHDTYFIIAHFHLVMAVSAFFGLFAGIYHWYPKMYGRHMNNTLSYVHFFTTYIGANLIFWPMHYEGVAGMPRRYYDFSGWQAFNNFREINEFISIITIVVFFAQLLFVFNFLASIFYGRKVLSLNPWNATTLEWTTPTLVPTHGNWPNEIPHVHRWAYDYRENGKGGDFIPQTEQANE
jgi:cytochrome c oxidase subunit I